ncbi:MAG: opacity protein-like surface antigen [Crocinitomix sp.]|jgi:opacity protein-like surface antigen
MRKIILISLIFGLSHNGMTQELNPYLEKGDLSLGLRTTTSLFGHDEVPGLGTGGQFRLQIFDFLSTEFFADWITLDLNGAGTRNNAHVGWSVLFYPKKTEKFMPYLIAGHCFDYAEVTPLSTNFLDRSSESISRWSSAVQGGVGAHYFLSERFNMTFSAQYMLHLGQHLDYELTEVGDGYYLDTDHSSTAEEATETHLLLTLSLNYRIADLW